LRQSHPWGDVRPFGVHLRRLGKGKSFARVLPRLNQNIAEFGSHQGSRWETIFVRQDPRITGAYYTPKIYGYALELSNFKYVHSKIEELPGKGQWQSEMSILRPPGDDMAATVQINAEDANSYLSRKPKSRDRCSTVHLGFLFDAQKNKIMVTVKQKSPPGPEKSFHWIGFDGKVFVADIGSGYDLRIFFTGKRLVNDQVVIEVKFNIA